ncbi:hypothetical protein LTR10_013399 [Elasticomyces elasticus]|uniref:Prion-inhibition and propagation HeLo domain-containing protein n=1 Tax=Exophiala sideris TaxID=1016849 RepID=A0ABR0J4X7_9EURO|nr:hypothetical protein LTR10_013399 [Elasticomyces elasticus]KAK5027371.1 hypothetical protein LTS07_006973 [Exophiala sideris]KAK5034927.1 hypothetical protein LTR13_006109 [Exophiala sideris]KAK5056339.1 hypothetical protein LTR69_007880 [Exophiala sideris]KAK5181172.1 hypothetical protein LTR44_006503 [Eurotiomycetes sp. CCFEE 6388]
MVDPVGAVLGGVSLAIQLLDGAVKGYNFFLAVGDFPARTLHLRTRLEIEQKSILDFSETAEILGIFKIDKEENIPRILRKNYLVLGSVFRQIEAKLDTLASFTSRYKELRHGEVEDDQEVTVAELDKKEQTPVLVKWEGAAKERQNMLGTEHIVKYYRIGRSIVCHPKRLRWTGVDEKKFKAVLDELAGYNNYLRKLLDGEYSKRLEERTVKTYQEMVLVRNQIADLTQLVTNAILLGHSGHQLEVLADTKRRSIANDSVGKDDFVDEDKPPQYHELVDVKKLVYKAEDRMINIVDPPAMEKAAIERVRSIGTFQRPGSLEPEVAIFVEWKRYTRGVDDKTEEPGPLSDDTKRAKGLVAILQSSKLNAFHTPECLGYFDLQDGEDSDASSPAPTLFGIVYKIPGPVSKPVLPTTLRAKLGIRPLPSLSARMKLAHQISDSLLYFNSVQWYHKSLRSDAILFQPHPETDLADVSTPLLTGFEYARPGGATSTKIPPDPARQLYVHPFYQNDPNASYQRSYDVYALGIILLEIAYWQPINLILGPLLKNKDGPTSSEAENVRSNLLDPSPESRILPDLRGLVGDRYHLAADSCIRGLVADDEDEDNIDVSMRLQDGFVRNVVDNLGTLVDL